MVIDEFNDYINLPFISSRFYIEICHSDLNIDYDSLKESIESAYFDDMTVDYDSSDKEYRIYSGDSEIKKIINLFE